MGIEWSLVVFTVFAQISIGLMLAAQVFGYKNRSQINVVLPWVGFFMLLSMLASLGHLGSPLSAPKAILNLKSSWLSREIFFAVGYFLLWFVSFIVERRPDVEAGLKQAIGGGAVIFGILTLISMGAIYASTMYPAWGTAYTYLSFFSSAIILGFMLYALLAYRASRQNQGEMLKFAFYVVAAGVIVQVVSLAPYFLYLSGGVAAAQESAKLMLDSVRVVALTQLIAILGGMVFTFRFWVQYQEQGDKLAVNSIYGSFFLLFISIMLSRYLFYATGVSIMVGQF